jgi:hypothetical protein
MSAADESATSSGRIVRRPNEEFPEWAERCIKFHESHGRDEQARLWRTAISPVRERGRWSDTR